MSKPREILTFSYKDEYGNEHEYKTVDITGMTESQINATKARVFGQMKEYVIGLAGVELDTIPIPNSEPMPDYMALAKSEEENLRLQSQNEYLLRENDNLLQKIAILKEMLVESYGN